MSDLLDLVLQAHGAVQRWQEAGTIHAEGAIGGLLWTMCGQEGILAATDLTVEVQRQRAVFAGFTDPGLRGVYTPDRVAIERQDGEVVIERTSPRAAFAGQGPETPWDSIHVLYFAGYAMWNYLTAPYLLTRPGVAVAELEPYEDWRRLRVGFPGTIATHSVEQVFYYDNAGLLRRHDYAPEILGGVPAAHLSENHVTASGLVFPTHRSVVPAGEGGRALPEPLLITIDLDEVTVAPQ